MLLLRASGKPCRALSSAAHPAKRRLCRELSPSGPSHSGALPKGPSRAETHSYFVILISLFPKPGAKSVPSFRKPFSSCVPRSIHRRMRQSTLPVYRRILLWCSELCVGPAKPQLGCVCAHGTALGSFGAQQTPQAKLRRGTEAMPTGLG